MTIFGTFKVGECHEEDCHRNVKTWRPYPCEYNHSADTLADVHRHISHKYCDVEYSPAEYCDDCQHLCKLYERMNGDNVQGDDFKDKMVLHYLMMKNLLNKD